MQHIFLVKIVDIVVNQNELRMYKIKLDFDKEMEVSSTVLYAFFRERPDANEDEATATSCSTEVSYWFQADKEVDFDEIVKELKTTLRNIWKLQEDERNKRLKRLFLHWHPDKNLKQQELCS